MGAAAYCIDANEVSNGQKAAFLAGTIPAPTPVCGYKSTGTYTPAGTWPILGKDNLPVGNVDWCDAQAYCASVNKHLCGAIGGGSVPFTPATAFTDATKSQWYNACSKGGANAYPYSNTFTPGACNATGASITVGSDAATCTGGFPGLVDMSGNVAEWEDCCDATVGTADNCHARGGSFASQQVDLSCTAGTTYARNTTDASLGFRCCAY
jgi:formylglycine-generating enzyme required for sulfatase activity